MQISQITQNFDKLAKSWKQQQEVYDEKFKQLEVKGSVDPLTASKIQKINDDINEQKSKIAELETAINRPDMDIKYYHNQTSFENYLKKGIEGNSNIDTKSLSSEGGFLLDNTTSKNIHKLMEADSIMRKLASSEQISTHALEIIKDNVTQESGWVGSESKWAGEKDERVETKITNLDRQVIEVHEIYAQPKVTQKLIDDAKIDIVKWITEKISQSFASLESKAFLHGNGVGQPEGLLSYEVKNSKDIRISQKTFSVEDIINLYYSLPSEYAAKGSFLMHRNMLQTIRSFKCPTTGHYLWSPGLALGEPDTLLGAPVYESVDMPIPSGGEKPIVFGDFKEAYKVVDRANINIIRDPFTSKPFIKFYATKRVGGSVVNSKAFKCICFETSQ